MTKLTTKDASSPRLCIIDNITDDLKSTSKVITKCSVCGTHKEIILSELVRTVNRQSDITEYYNCPKCFRSNPKSIEKRTNASVTVIDKIKNGASERAKKVWESQEFRDRMHESHKHLKGNKEFANKISDAIKEKFASDKEYVDKIIYARNNKYKSSRHMPLAEFVDTASRLHNGRYDYSKVNYINSRIKVEIVCKDHGSFWTRPSHHLHYLNGCPQCNNEKTRSNGEIKLYEWIKSIYGGEIICSDRKMLNGLELDIFIPDKKLGIEYHGAWYHSFGSQENAYQKYYHSMKSTLAHKRGINLLQFVDLDLEDRINVAKSMIIHKLGMNKRIWARLCNIEIVNRSDAIDFFKNNHYHGYSNFTIAYGLYYKDILVSCIAFMDKGEFWDISRFATLCNYCVVGGFSKLVSAHVRSKPIMTYVDRSFTTMDSCYSKNGMEFLGITKPGYRYLKNNRLYGRMRFQKHKLPNILDNFDNNLSESENMFCNGYRRLWDAGNLIYRLK